jgi:hypothetical protein
MHAYGQVIERAAQLWKTDERKSSLADRVELYGGDFFDVGGHALQSCSIPVSLQMTHGRGWG